LLQQRESPRLWRVHLWHIESNAKTDGVIHRATLRFGHALLSPMVAHAFEELRVAAAVWDHDVYWMPIHTRPALDSFEQEHGRDEERRQYNGAMFARVLAEKRAIRGDHAGLSDLFAPILARGKVVGILVCGPFARERLTRSAVIEQWRWLTGGSAHPADPAFAAYLARRLEILVLEGDQAPAFERLVICLTQLMAGVGRADEIANRAEVLRAELQETRFVDRMWESARTMVDDRSARVWQGVNFEKSRRLLGLSRTPDDVLVGLMVSRSKGDDPVDEALRRDAFQRAAAYFARKRGDLIAGRVGDHGVVLLSSARGSPAKRKERLLDLAERASGLARKGHGLSLSFGLSLASRSVTVSRTYLAALGAAEHALGQGTRFAVAEPSTGRPTESLRQLRDELGRVAEAQPERLEARFDRYLEVVAAQHGYGVEPVRGHLDAAFERIVEPFVKSGTLDRKSLKESGEVLDRAASDARSASDLFAAYRRVVADLCEARRRPVRARHDRSLRAALDHIHQHYAEALPLESVARVAGFSADHFSKLFKKREGMTFERYLGGFRIEQAKRLLGETDLGVARIGELCGFHSPQYFCRAFLRWTALTPMQHRKKRRRSRHG
jgi:AraC-like DNA-binding protein